MYFWVVSNVGLKKVLITTSICKQVFLWSYVFTLSKFLRVDLLDQRVKVGLIF